MSSYTLNLTLENIRMITVMFVDIFILWLILYYALKIVRSNTRTIQIFKGIILVTMVDGIARFLGLKTLQFFADMFINWGLLGIIIIFQPELRSLLEQLGKNNLFSRISTLSGNEKEHLVEEIVKSVMVLSKDSTGALISIEQSHTLDDYVSTGIRMNSDVSAELLTSLFVTSTPMHDGAVIIQGDKIACASAYFPPTNAELPSRYGARHRAAIGISEITDSVTIVVSEETGAVSIADSGKLFPVNRTELTEYLMRVICGKSTEVKVKAGSLEEEKIVVIPDDHPTASHSLSEIHARADEEAMRADMKLPHKKAKSTTRRTVVSDETETTVVKDPAVVKPKKMKPEEVSAARNTTASKATASRKNGGDF